MTLTPGTTLGPYEVEGPLGAGGMGEVYRARDTRLDRTVAVKVLPSAVAADADRRARFEREAKMVSALRHPHICALYDVGQQDGIAYLVMELLEGETLAARLARGPLPLEQTLRFGAQIADALDKVHRLGIVHRDLKPGNVMVTREGVKLLDFGLAKRQKDPTSGAPAAAALSSLPTESKTLTTAGTLLGTFHYMAPEQLEGKEADERSDIWALGCVLYEMASGRRPFAGNSEASLISSILRDEPRPLSALDPLTPAALDRVVRRCLAKDPEERWSSAHDVALELTDIDPRAAAVPVGRPPARRRAMAVIVPLVAAALSAIGTWALVRRGPAAAPGPAAGTAAVRFHRVTFRPGTVYEARFSGDGQTIVYSAAWEGGEPDLFLTRQGSTEARPLGFPGMRLLSLSPSGDMALFRGHMTFPNAIGTIVQAGLTGGASRALVDPAHPIADWSAADRLAALVHVDNRVDRLEHPLGTAMMDIGGWQPTSIRFAPDGSRLALSRWPRPGESPLVVVEAGGQLRPLLAKDWEVDRGLAWSPDGREVWFSGFPSDQGPPAIHAVSLDGKVRTLLRQSGWITLYDAHRDGRVLAGVHGWRGGILVGRTGERSERDLGWLDYSEVGAISADGGTILFSERREGGGTNGSVYLRKTDGSPAVRLGDGTARDLSPDGRWALVTRDGDFGHVHLLPTGAGAPRSVAVAGRAMGGPAWLPDGRRVVLTVAAREDRTPAIVVLDTTTGESRRASPEGFSAYARAVTPDGAAVACAGRETDVRYLCPLDGGEPRRVPGLRAGDVPLLVSRDGRDVLVAVGDTLPRRVDRVNLKTGARTAWRALAPADRTGLTGVSTIVVSPDESAWAYSYDRMLSDLYVVEGLR